MDAVTLKNAPLSGTATAIPSKSAALRFQAMGFLADGAPGAALSPANDAAIMRDALDSMSRGETIAVHDCAAALRFLIPIALLRSGGAEFLCTDRLKARVLDSLDVIDGCSFRWRKNRLYVSGRLLPGEYRLRGDASSQLISGLIMALPLLEGESVIKLTCAPVSRPYIIMTLDAAARCGVSVRESGDCEFIIPGAQRYERCVHRVEGDWSYAANFIAANAFGGDVRLEGLSHDSLQPDSIITAALDKHEFDMCSAPDLLPVLAVNACARHGRTRLYNALRLRNKESDRLCSSRMMIEALGGEAVEHGDALEIYGRGRLAGGTVDPMGDHRIAMAAAVSAAICDSPVTVLDPGCVKKSAPRYFDEIARLGGMIY